MDKKTLQDQVKAAMAVGGYRMRYALMAYAMFRQVPYKRLELTTREDNKPRVTLLYEAFHGIRVEGSKEQKEAALASFKTWLETPATSELLEAARKAREECIAAKQARSEEVQRQRAWDKKVELGTIPASA